MKIPGEKIEGKIMDLSRLPKLNALNNQTVEIKVNDIPLSKLTDNLKPIINAMAYMKGEK